VIVLAVLVVGCGVSVHIPANLRTPAIVGVVEASTQLTGGNWSYRLKTGQTLEINYDATTSLLGGPQIGRLLLAGEDPDGRQWVAGLRPSTDVTEPGCFLLDGVGRDAGQWIETSSGFRLPKAANFDPGSTDGKEFALPLGGFCINEKGEVTSYVG